MAKNTKIKNPPEFAFLGADMATRSGAMFTLDLVTPDRSSKHDGQILEFFGMLALQKGHVVASGAAMLCALGDCGVLNKLVSIVGIAR